MKVYVEPKVEAGLNRGGEDLHLVVTAEYESEFLRLGGDGDAPDVDELEVVLLAEDDCPGCSVECDDDSGEKFVVGPVRYCTNHYEVEWSGTGEDVLDKRTYAGDRQVTVREFLQDLRNWFFHFRYGDKPKLVCTLEVYVGGNAD